MTDSPQTGSGRVSEEWAKAYGAFLLFVGLILLVLLAKGLYLGMVLLAVAVVGIAVLVRRFGRDSR